jgi:hypothetical protein
VGAVGACLSRGVLACNGAVRDSGCGRWQLRKQERCGGGGVVCAASLYALLLSFALDGQAGMAACWGMRCGRLQSSCTATIAEACVRPQTEFCAVAGGDCSAAGSDDLECESTWGCWLPGLQLRRTLRSVLEEVSLLGEKQTAGGFGEQNLFGDAFVSTISAGARCAHCVRRATVGRQFARGFPGRRTRLPDWPCFGVFQLLDVVELYFQRFTRTLVSVVVCDVLI